MSISPSFLFTQSNLQDYTDCPRRFFLKYLRKLAWPSIESEPVQEIEHFRLQGEIFHKMAHQLFLGIPPHKITDYYIDPLLRNWWENFLSRQEALINLKETRCFPETTHSAVLGSFRLLAKYDLFVINPDGKYCIYDWKTYRRRPRREQIARKIQTRLYPFLLYHSTNKSTSQRSLSPENFCLIYFYTNFPDQPERFEYSQVQYHKDLDYLSGLLNEIVQSAHDHDETAFPLTANIERCLFCTYRSLCNRGIRAGNSEQILLDLELDASQDESASLESFDFDNVAEIEF